MQIRDLMNHVFRTSSKDNIICPPDQVFLNPDFEFLFTIGGHLAENSEEYNKLIVLLQEIGESEFFIVENLGATVSQNDKPNIDKFSIEITFEQFDEEVKKYDPPFGFYINHFYVFGKSKNWGIYICENPTINIIGCTIELKERFAEVYSIKDNGFAELERFIDKEYAGTKDLKDLLIVNYKVA